MANLPESSVWEAGVYQLETTDPVIGGPEGVDNKQAKQLANRTVYLKGITDALASGATPAGKADTWATARSISMTGDGSWTVTANGSGNVTAAMTLANSGVAAGSYSKVTVDAKGRVTAGTVQTEADIPALDWSKITTGKPTTLGGYGITDASGPTIKPTFAQALMVADPVNAMEAATKQYVDNMASGIQVKQSAHAATTGNITLSGLQTIDGVVLVAGDRVLVKAQTTASQNGIYIAVAGAWTRPSDADTWQELISAFCFIEEGTVNADTGWVCTINAGGSLGITSVTWTQFAGAGTVTAGAGMTVIGNQVAVGVPSTVSGSTTNTASGSSHTHQVAAATEVVAGVSEIATQVEVDAAADDTRIVTPKKLRFGFAVSFATNGYLKFPSWLGGFLIQWGTVQITPGSNTNSNTDITFPIAFTGGCTTVSLTLANSPVLGGVNASSENLSTTGFRIVSAAFFSPVSAINMRYIAMGY
ncbi:hypothetical protein KUF54_03165 [Comamonas sp. Y33R10-2]|uniref:gp53-like domain-containing protein n=1 Tax=Comamonas sp. Y33R10-2 TaxID=2853257 RepID=UPI001C5CB779|nr:hypothetical protein [Comamonas sp. Y33R10-2]QXZ11477.1 hypothetical protein KUF54_03165 [Comamonas sp. Y33R10-2]